MRGDFLHVLWDGNIVGTLTPSVRGRKGRVCFRYAPEWIETFNRRISLALPCGTEPFNADLSTRFFGNLLPEGAVYDKLCEEKRIRHNDVFSFLRVFGAECAGALAIVDPAAHSASEMTHASNDYVDITGVAPVKPDRVLFAWRE